MPATVRVETFRGSEVHIAYTCQNLDVQLASDNYTDARMTGALQLRDDVTRTDSARSLGAQPSGIVTLPDLVFSPAFITVPPINSLNLKNYAKGSDAPSMQKLAHEATKQTTQLCQSIASELHSRASFSLSCLTLVLLGAALGLLMRGKNPLAVFVVGLFPPS